MKCNVLQSEVDEGMVRGPFRLGVYGKSAIEKRADDEIMHHAFSINSPFARLSLQPS